MNISKIMTVCAAAALAVGMAGEVFAQAAAPAVKSMPGRITRKDGTQISGNIRWMAQGKKYVVSQQLKDGKSVSTDVLLSEVSKVETPKPEKFDAAAKAVQAGKASAAIPVLEAIVAQYAMLGWDEPATRYLAQAKLASGDAAGAIKMCEAIIATKPDAAYLGEMAPTYWQALLKTDKKAKLSELISKAISNGDRAASAAALVMRGDILMEQKEPMNALKDGYLRAVILYENVRAIQPEALYKAAKAFETLSQNGNAEKLRTTLRTKYAQSEYAKML